MDNINIVSHILDYLTTIVKVKLATNSQSIVWRFSKGHMYQYVSSSSSASVETVKTIEDLEKQLNKYLLHYKGTVTIKYNNDQKTHFIV